MNVLLKSILVSFLILFSQKNFASPSSLAGLVQWQPHPKMPVLLLPIRRGETRKKAVKRYLWAIKHHEQMRELLERSPGVFKDIDVDNTKMLNQVKIIESERAHFLFMANSYRQISSENRNFKKFLELVQSFGANVFALPPGADTGLGKNTAKNFRVLIAETFDALVSVGGGDIHPRLYNQEITYAHKRDLNMARDASELRMIQVFIKRMRGVFYGICRGAQLCSVAKGAGLIQDLEHEGGVGHIHHNNHHSVIIRKGSLLAKFVKKKKMLTKSLHHQATIPGNKNIVVAAHHGDAENFVIEAWQFHNRLGLSVQFHPEYFSENIDNRNLIKGMVDYAKEIKSERKSGKGCSNLLETN